MNVPMSRPFHNAEMEERVIEVLRSGRYINGPMVKDFEAGFAVHMGVEHAVAVNSCTSGIQLALMACGVGPGDGVLVPSMTAYPTVEPIMHLGARPVFVDVDDSFTLDPADLAAKADASCKAVMPVHLYGLPVDMDPVLDVARERGLKVIEDCAQAHDAVYKGRKAGALGDVSCYSFFPSKNMSVAGDGGMVATGDPALAETVRMLRNHGRKARYEHELVGFNYRLSEMHAAVGLVQLAHLDEFVAGRRRCAARYVEGLAGLPLRLPWETAERRHAYHLYVVRTADEASRDALGAHLKERGVANNIHYPVPCHLQPGTALAGFPMAPGSLPRTEEQCATILSLPIFPTITDEEIDHVCASVREFFG